MFSNIYPEPFLVQLEAIPSSPSISYMGEEVDSYFNYLKGSCNVDSNKVSSKPPLLQAERPRFLQLLPIRLMLQSFTSFVSVKEFVSCIIFFCNCVLNPNHTVPSCLFLVRNDLLINFFVIFPLYYL